MAQQFDTVDYLRLEVEADPTGLVNLVQNPSGELGGWGWVTPLSSSTIIKHPLSPSLTYQRTVAGASYYYTEPMPVAAGQYVAGTYRIDGSNCYQAARFEYLDASLSVLSSSTQTGISGSNATFNLGPFVVPASTVFVRLRFDLYGSAGGATPGGGQGILFSQVTVAKAPTSAELGSLRTNLIPNPSFETNTTGWSNFTNATLSRTTSHSHIGSASLVLTSSAAGSMAAQTLGGTSGIPVTGSTYYAAQVRSKAATLSRSVIIGYAWYDAAGTAIGSTTLAGGPSNNTSTWTQRTLLLTSPANAAFVKILVGVSLAGAAGEVHFFDAVLLEQSSTAGTYFDGSTAAGGGITHAWTGTAHNSASTASTSNLVYIEPVPYVDILGECREIRVKREALNIGTLTAEVLSASLDPSRSDSIRPGRRCRLRAYDTFNAEWTPLFTGNITEASVTYELKDPSLPSEKRARIQLSAVDNTFALTNQKRAEGVTTTDELPYVLEGCGVPWNVNGSGDQVAGATVVAVNENASALDQVAITRDTNMGYAWVDRHGTLQVWDPSVIERDATPYLSEDVFTNLDKSYNTQDCINEVTIRFLRHNPSTGETEEVPYGPYRDQASIDEWGVRAASFTIQGLSEETSDIPDLADSILAANSEPAIKVNSVACTASETWMLDRDYLLADVMDFAFLDWWEDGIYQWDEGFVASIEHTITPTKWLVKFDFLHPDVVASPQFTPSPLTGAGGLTIGQLLRPVGEVTMYFSSTPPAGWLLCNGGTFSSNDYPDLAAALGDTFGVHSGTTYYLPNFTDRFPIGSGTKAIGTSGGSTTVTLVANNLPAHTHGIARRAGAAGSGDVAIGNATAASTGGTAVNTTTNAPVDVLNPWRSIAFIIRAR